MISFTQDTEQKTGVAARTVREDIQIATQILAEVKDRLRDTPLADSKTDLLKLARMKREE